MSEPNNEKARDAARNPHDEGWPDTIRTRSELDAALEKGERSGRSKERLETILERALSSKDG